jgi:hypothetical protein
VDTAGPQPGTFRSEEHRWTSSWDPRAQWAPRDLNLEPSRIFAR